MVSKVVRLSYQSAARVIAGMACPNFSTAIMRFLKFHLTRGVDNATYHTFGGQKSPSTCRRRKTSAKLFRLFAGANIAVQLEIKCIFRYLRSSTPLWIIYLCAMGMSQNMLDLL